MDSTDVRDRVASIDWWHEIDLGDGIVTPGRGHSSERLERIGLPADLSGRTVLDIGAFDGMFSFEAERRGAARAVALDNWKKPGFELAHQVLGSRVEFVCMDVRDMTPEDPGVFDLVLFMGVLYHVPNPMRALEQVAAVTGDHLILESATAVNWLDVPAARFQGSRKALEDTSRDWWVPNVPCLEEMLRSVGFTRVETVFPDLSNGRGRLGRMLRRVAPTWFGTAASRAVVHAWK